MPYINIYIFDVVTTIEMAHLCTNIV